MLRKLFLGGNGLAVYLTKEAKELDWSIKTRVIVKVIEDQEGKGIEIREAPISKAS